jgi:hypothetical protein
VPSTPPSTARGAQGAHAEFGRSLAAVLRTTYAEIVSDMRKAGVQPVS